MIMRAEGNGILNSQVQVGDGFNRLYEFCPGNVSSGAFQPFHQDHGIDISFEAYKIGFVIREILFQPSGIFFGAPEQILCFRHFRRGHNLGYDYAFPLLAQPSGQFIGTDKRDIVKQALYNLWPLPA